MSAQLGLTTYRKAAVLAASIGVWLSLGGCVREDVDHHHDDHAVWRERGAYSAGYHQGYDQGHDNDGDRDYR